MMKVDSINFDHHGIKGNVPCLPLRQVLLLPTSTLAEFGLRPGDLRENIVVEFDELHSLPSGTVVHVGQANIRLTFHCEPCKRVGSPSNVRNLNHKRGVFGLFLNSGIIRDGDVFTVEGRDFDPIPYNYLERLQWYLDQQIEPVSISQILHDIGLSRSYARVIPRMVRRLPGRYWTMITPLVACGNGAIEEW